MKRIAMSPSLSAVIENHNKENHNSDEEISDILLDSDKQQVTLTIVLVCDGSSCLLVYSSKQH